MATAPVGCCAPLRCLPASQPGCRPLAFCRLAGLGAAFFLGLLLQFLGCALWHNWWPMLTAFVYVLVPMVSAGGLHRCTAAPLVSDCWVDSSANAAASSATWPHILAPALQPAPPTSPTSSSAAAPAAATWPAAGRTRASSWWASARWRPSPSQPSCTTRRWVGGFMLVGWWAGLAAGVHWAQPAHILAA